MDAQDDEKTITTKEKTLSLNLQYLAPVAAFSWLGMFYWPDSEVPLLLTFGFGYPVTLIVLLVAWAASNSPRYPSQNGLIPCMSIGYTAVYS